MPAVPHRTLLAASLAAGALAAPAAHAAAAGARAVPPPEPAIAEVAPGVSQQRLVRPDGTVVHVLRARPSALTRLEPVLPGGATSRRGDLAAVVAAGGDAGVVAGVNGDYFNVSAAYPSGLTALQGRLVSEPEPTRTALVIGADRTLTAGRFTFTGRWQVIDASGLAIGRTRSVAGVNRPSERSSEMLVYTADHGSATPAGGSRNEATVRVDGGAAVPVAGTVTGTVVAGSAGGGTPLTPGSVVITGVGSARATVVRDLPVGQRVRIDTQVAGLPPDASAVGGGPLLVDGRAAVPSIAEGFSSAQLTARTSRTAVAQAPDGGYILATVEGPSQGRRGVTAAEQAALMSSLGARLAVGMDAGGSAQMVVSGRHVVPWSSPRAVTTAVLLRYDGVRVAPVTRRLSPNGDRIDDAAEVAVTAPRTGRLRVTAVRRGRAGGPVLLDQPVLAGTHTVPLDPRSQGIADGPWEVRAALTPDDGSAPTTARRALVIDRTLAGLTTRAVRIRTGRRARPSVEIRFRLLRPARVTVRVLDGAGRLRRTIRAGRGYGRGPVRVVWDRRIGRTVASGPVRIVVEARTSLGRPALVSDLTLPRPPAPPGTPTREPSSGSSP